MPWDGTQREMAANVETTAKPPLRGLTSKPGQWFQGAITPVDRSTYREQLGRVAAGLLLLNGLQENDLHRVPSP